VGTEAKDCPAIQDQWAIEEQMLSKASWTVEVEDRTAGKVGRVVPVRPAETAVEEETGANCWSRETFSVIRGARFPLKRPEDWVAMAVRVGWAGLAAPEARVAVETARARVVTPDLRVFLVAPAMEVTQARTDVRER